MECNFAKNGLRIVRGNAFAIRLTVSAIHIDGTPVENFVLGDAEAVLKVMHLDGKTPKDFLIIGNDAIISFGGDLSLGWYGFEMTGTFNGKPWRWCVPQVFQIVETNANANVPAWAVLTDETYAINGVMTIISGDIYQSDWDETDPQSPSYIKNKPDVVLHPEFNQTVQRIDRDIDAEEIRAKAAEKQNADDIDDIEALIPAQATPQNQLADKQYVDDGISTASATYRGAYNLVSDLELTVAATEQQIAAALATNMTALGITPDNNDYCFVQVPTADATPTEIARVDRYKYNGTAWAFEFSLNNSGFTAAQWAALNSGITSGLVTKLSDLPTNSELTTLLGGKEDNSNKVTSLSAESTDTQYPSAKCVYDLHKANADDIDDIEDLIPAQATPQNQLADKQYVDDGISTASATYRGAYNLVSDLELTTAATEQQIAAALATVMAAATPPIVPDNNDYCFVQVPTDDATPTEIARVDRYKYNGTAWAFEFSLNNSGFTAAQWAALNSGITSGLVTKLSDLPTNSELTILLNGKQDTISDLSDIRSGAAAGATAYQKPTGGIPKGDLDSSVQTSLGKADTAIQDVTQIENDIDNIEKLIPQQATEQNQLADKQFVNSSISTATATYRGAYNLVSDLELTTAATEQQIAAALATKMAALSITPDNNDYCFVQVPTDDATPTEIARVDRYKYNGTAWAFEFSLNNSGFTAAQWAALNSGITSGLVTKLSDLPTNSELTQLLNGKEDNSNKVTSLSADSTDTQYPSAKCVYDLHKANADDIDDIEALIPAQATPQNQLADKQYVDDGISTASATYRGAYNLVSDLELTTAATEQQIAAALATVMAAATPPIVPDNNDYCFVQVPTADATPTQIARVDRYKFNGTAWAFEFSLNNSGFTAAQWAALNSGITSGLVTKLGDLPTNSELTTLLNGKEDNSNKVTSLSADSTDTQYPSAKCVYDLHKQNADDIDDIEDLIPAQATPQNQLADKAYVDGKAPAPVLTVMNIIADTTSAPTITGAANAGKQETIIYRNTGGQDVTVTVGVSGGSPVTPNGQSIVLACPVGSYVEVNYLNIGGTIYARGV